MAGVSNSGFIIIGQDPKTKDFFVHERENKNGQPGKINGKMIDGRGDVRPTINEYVKDGFDPKKIIINGQPVTDVFTKTTDANGNVAFKGKNKKTTAAENAETPKKKSGFFKKAAVATASSVLPGLGQAINGQWGKAAFYAIGAPVLTVAAFMLNPIAGIAVGSALEIGNVVSAYRNA